MVEPGGMFGTLVFCGGGLIDGEGSGVPVLAEEIDGATGAGGVGVLVAFGVPPGTLVAGVLGIFGVPPGTLLADGLTGAPFGTVGSAVATCVRAAPVFVFRGQYVVAVELPPISTVWTLQVEL